MAESQRKTNDRESVWFFRGEAPGTVAHLGALAVLQQECSFDCVVGVSGGALVGLFQAFGFSPEEILGVIRKELGPGLLACLPGGAYLNLLRLLRGKVAKRLPYYIPRSARLEDLTHPRLIITCTDLVEKKCVPIDRGSAVDAVVASISVPCLARPVIRGSMVLVDGGVADNCPCHVLQPAEIDVVVAVDATAIQPAAILPGRSPSLVQTLRGIWEVQQALPGHRSRRQADSGDPSGHFVAQLRRYFQSILGPACGGGASSRGSGSPAHQAVAPSEAGAVRLAGVALRQRARPR